MRLDGCLLIERSNGRVVRIEETWIVELAVLFIVRYEVQINYHLELVVVLHRPPNTRAV